MTRFGPEWTERGADPDAPESRFTRRPAVAIVPDEATASAAYDERHRVNPRRAAVSRVVGDWILEEDPDLGAPRTVDGSSGRGAEMWAVVLLWLAFRILDGIVENVAWEATKRVARRLNQVVERVRTGDRAGVHVAAGTARLIAIDAVLERHPDEEGPLDMQAIEEPSTMSGTSPYDLTYGASEPWIVVLVNSARTDRYIVVVEPSGEVAAVNRLELSPMEASGAVHVEIPGGTEDERTQALRRASEEGRGPWAAFKS